MFDPWLGKIPWRRKWQPSPVLLPGESNAQRSLAGYRPWVHKEADRTERLTLSLSHLIQHGVLLRPGEFGQRGTHGGDETRGEASGDEAETEEMQPRPGGAWDQRELEAAGRSPGSRGNVTLPSPGLCIPGVQDCEHRQSSTHPSEIPRPLPRDRGPHLAEPDDPDRAFSLLRAVRGGHPHS